jgi:hypothetical protein
MEDTIPSQEGIIGGMAEQPDHVARIQAEWARERPDLDVSPQGVIGRLHRLAGHLTEQLCVVYRRYGLGEGRPSNAPPASWRGSPWSPPAR